MPNVYHAWDESVYPVDSLVGFIINPVESDLSGGGEVNHPLNNQG